MNQFRSSAAFPLEQGGELRHLNIAYTTYGTLNAAADNVVWICHALTANADPLSWWPGFAGKGHAIDPEKYFIVCANILGSCYGTTGPLSINPDTGTAYFHNFPFITIRDMVNAHRLLREHLRINSIELLVGGSMGGYQVLEWAVMEPAIIKQLMMVATSARESPWGIAIHSAQRLAIEADDSWRESIPEAGSKGMKAARAIAMITYRHYQTYSKTQADDDPQKIKNFKAASYIDYQGEKLVNRFNAFSYYLLTQAMDSHNIARDRAENPVEVLKTITQPSLIIAITSDLLCPPIELKSIANNLPNATYREIDSIYGHDGFLTEAAVIGGLLRDWQATPLIHA